MKNLSSISALSSAVLTLIFAASCDKNICIADKLLETQAQVEPATFTVSVAGTGTKALAGTSDENKINNIQVAVFRSNPGYSDDGVLEAFVKSSGTSVTINCTVGTKRIYVLANAPDLDPEDICAQDLIDEQQVSLYDDARNSFQMCGISSATIDKNTDNISVQVIRYAARVHVKSIVCNFQGFMDEAAFVPKSLTLINAVTHAMIPDYSITPNASFFVNQGQWTTSAVDNMVRSTISGVTLSSTGTTTYNTAHNLYAYANSSTNTAHATTWVPVCTRLVLEAAVDGVTYYYPVNLPGIQANHSYEIEALTVTRIGSKSPDIPVEPTACTFSVTVKSWEDVNITSGISL